MGKDKKNHKDESKDKKIEDHKINENNENTPNQDAVMNLANNLFKNENSFDFGSIMRMATNLLSNDSLMNSVQEIGQGGNSQPKPEGTNSKPEHIKPSDTPEVMSPDMGLQGGMGAPSMDPLMGIFQGISQLGFGAEPAIGPSNPAAPVEGQKEKPVLGNNPNEADFSMIKEQLAKIASDILDIKNELKTLKELKTTNEPKDEKKKKVNQISTDKNSKRNKKKKK
ncbi:hypothetical protein [Neobacillus mesonae]|uniref:hypothetical protein n=1 Tax=Neobacillus mesonae TaxID=1193713 RepID=UPI00203CFE27|nr:hypothetical protein [Neobacillus mesonae]MCM3569557.1 hypothetical protein [Neobacillus mesonae]